MIQCEGNDYPLRIAPENKQVRGKSGVGIGTKAIPLTREDDRREWKSRAFIYFVLGILEQVPISLSVASLNTSGVLVYAGEDLTYCNGLGAVTLLLILYNRTPEVMRGPIVVV